MSKWKSPWELRNPNFYEDPRGGLFEVLRFKDDEVPGVGQIYTFSIAPGMRRGDHYHKKKEEWFTCVSGTAIVLLSSDDGKCEAIELSATKPGVIYSAPGTSHALVNEKSEPAVIVSYGSKQHDPDDPDTFANEAYPGWTGAS
ncbi:MAG: WxcM-like domain-containing protein [Verrucomicrobiales bacterium]|nr:WxcM-like domain-containing protein [Verrucomicrobiales bacterium]